MATDSGSTVAAAAAATGTAWLIWSTPDRLRLKLKTDNEVVTLNREYTYETGLQVLLPDDLAVYDEDEDEIENPSFVSIRKNYSIHYQDVRYYFKGVVTERPSPQQQQQLDIDMEKITKFLDKMMLDSETLILSKPKTKAFNDAFTKSKVIKDMPAWNERPIQIANRESTLVMNDHIWLSSKEDSPENRQKYMTYLRDTENILLPDRGKLFEGNSDKNLLSVEIEDLEIKTCGNIDVALASSAHQGLTTIRQNLWAGIELKKDTNIDYSGIERQVVLQHFAASYLNANTGILTIMTDLCKRWHFFWFSSSTTERRLMRFEATKWEAQFLIQQCMGTAAGSTIHNNSFPEDFLNRASWNQMFGNAAEYITEDGDQEEGDSEGGATSLARSTQGDSMSRFTSGGQSEGTVKQGDSTNSPKDRTHRGKTCGEMQDTATLEQFMDYNIDLINEEEPQEATFRAVLKSSLHQMMYFPGRQDKDKLKSRGRGPPEEIVCNLLASS